MPDYSPMSRDEKLLRKLLGQAIQTEEPQSRIEALLKQLIDEGGVGGGYEIKGSYATLADLQAAHPTGNAGDAYLVGDPSHIYVWLTDSAEWHDGGAFSAVAGEDGVGIASIAKTATVGLVDTYTITLTDNTTYTYDVTNGAPGEGVPEGGTTGQILQKKSNSDYDTEWVNNSGGSNYDSQIESLETVNSTQTSEISSLASEIDSMSVSDYDSEINSLASENSTQSSEIASLASEVQSLSNSDYDSQIASLSTENSTQASEINSLASENEAAASLVASISTSLSELASNVASTSTAQSEVDSTQNVSLGSLSTENSTQSSEIDSLASAIDSMSVSDYSSEIASLETVNSTQTSEIGSLSTENSTQTSELGSLSTENSTQDSEIDSLSTAASELNSQVTDIASELAEKQDELTAGPGITIDNNEISAVNIFTGTLQTWEALTTEEKLEYTHAAITNDTKTGAIDVNPTANSPHAVSSGGVFTSLANTAKLDSINVFADKQELKNANLDTTDTPAAKTYGANALRLTDANDVKIASLYAVQNTDGSIDLEIDTNQELANIGRVLINGKKPMMMPNYDAGQIISLATQTWRTAPKDVMVVIRGNSSASGTGYAHIFICISNTQDANQRVSSSTFPAGFGSATVACWAIVPKGTKYCHLSANVTDLVVKEFEI